MEKHGIFSNLKTDLENILREGARKLLQQVIENEIQELIDSYKNQKDETGRRTVKGNGYLPCRQIQTGLRNSPYAPGGVFRLSQSPADE